MIFTGTREVFAQRQTEIQEKDESYLIGSARAALRRLMRGEKDWFVPLLKRVDQVARTAYRRESAHTSSDTLRTALNKMRADLEKAMAKTKEPGPGELETRAKALASSLASLGNAVGVEAAADVDKEDIGLEWVTLHGQGGDDGRVRAAHLAAAGQVRRPGEKYDVGGEKMARPGDVTASPELWINCRCALRPVPMDSQAVTASTTGGTTMTMTTTRTSDGTVTTFDPPLEVEITAAGDVDFEEDDLDIDDITGEVEVDELVPWHGVLAPEGVLSGDNRKFGTEALTWRDLPLPLRWQKEDWGQHDGAITVGRIDNIYREGNLVWGEGFMLSTIEADEAIGMMAEGGLRGVSVDVDKATMRLEDESGNELTMDSEVGPDTVVITSFPEGRISGATLCAIPAFMEAFVSLGARIVEGDEVAASAETEEFVKTEDGPGWLTHPVDTERLRRYWTKGPGAAKIRWGIPGDFNRCRQQLAKYIKPQYLSGYCANRHYDALGFWPGRPVSADTVQFAISDKPWDGSASRFTPEQWRRSCLIDTGEGDEDSKSRYKLPIREPNGDLSRAGVHAAAGRINQTQAPEAQISKAKAALRSAYKQLGEEPPETLALIVSPALRLVASGEKFTPPRSWFEDPGFTEPTRLTITDEGRVFGHLAEWGTCHIGIAGVCVTPPPSSTNYGYFVKGMVETDDGPVRVGVLTMETGHAEANVSPRVAAAHYDNTGAQVARVAMGEDDIGIWFSGMLCPGVTQEQIDAMRAAGSVSGDWREFVDDLDLCAALVVNVPGFPITPTQIAASGGHQTALIAAGMVTVQPQKKTIQQIVEEAVVERLSIIERQKRMADLKARTGFDPKSRMAALAAGRK